jgi:hypothetical protein
MNSFLLKLPAYTIVSARDGRVLMITNRLETCPHLFTDWDLADRYMDAGNLRRAYRSATMADRTALVSFLERALEHSTDVIVDPTIRDGNPFRGVRLAIEQILQTAADVVPARRIS